ncbi:p-hydroxyphenylacetate 3-hydroxylase, reductase component [Candidatus Calditenuaceae archaeon HR02]|nr:p-hydroxyphenylacetate 3-hydroxylase, reductase component [Candidatus Calditenuaceae archaeon HR02]
MDDGLRDLTARQEGLKAFMRLYPQGVTVVTTWVGDRAYGMTVSSFTSVSMNPPLVLIAIDRSANSYKAFTEAQMFAIHILSSSQALLSEIFAGRQKNHDKFKDVNYKEGPEKVPLLNDTLAYLVCRRYRIYEAGDHDLIICEVLDVVIKNPDLKPLIYRNRAYTTVAS